MLINVLRDEQPTHVAVAFDVSRKTFRMDEYAEYKAKRNKTPDEFRSQLPLIEEVLTSLRIPFLKKDGYEADDIIATLTTQAVADGPRGADPHRRPRRLPAGHRPSDGALPHARGVRAGADDPGGGRGEVRRAPAALSRARGDRGGDLRQPARRARGGPGLRREVDQPVRRPRQRHHPRRPDHRQEGRGPPRAPRRRAPQPPPQRARLRPRPRPRAGRPRPQAVGPPRRVHTLFDGLEFRVSSATGSFDTLESGGGASTTRLRDGRAPARSRRGRRFLGARRASTCGVHVAWGPGARGTGSRSTAIAVADVSGLAAYLDVAEP